MLSNVVHRRPDLGLFPTEVKTMGQGEPLARQAAEREIIPFRIKKDPRAIDEAIML